MIEITDREMDQRFENGSDQILDSGIYRANYAEMAYGLYVLADTLVGRESRFKHDYPKGLKFLELYIASEQAELEAELEKEDIKMNIYWVEQTIEKLQAIEEAMRRAAGE